MEIDVSSAKTEENQVRAWIKEMDGALKREKNYREKARKIVKLYEGKTSRPASFNILYANTETLAPSLYSVTPRPKVQRRFKDDDPLGKHASLVVRRTLEYLMDSGHPEYTEYSGLMNQAVLEGLVPGRGVTRFKYDADVTAEKSETAKVGGELAEDAEVSYETVCGQEVAWDRFLSGYAKRWNQVPWVAFIHYMTREELKANFGDELGGKVNLTGAITYDDDEKETSEGDSETKDVATVYEVWDKKGKKVFFVSDGYLEGYLKQMEDPLKLVGFFPCPEPLAFSRKISDLCPVPIYTFYEEQAKELNRVSQRINKLVDALKVRGFYDSSIEGIDKILEAEDNTLIATPNAASLTEKTLGDSIYFMPLQELITALQQLYIERDQTKAVIYEITGISDILRGQSAASESATAQKIKNEWGNLRLRRWQREVQRYARDCLRLMAEIAVTRLAPETIAAMTGLEYPSPEEKAQAEQQLQMFISMPPEQREQVSQDPSFQEQQAEVEKTLNTPSWDEILGMLQDDALRSYKIDIETNSTLDADVSEDKQNMTEFVNSMSQFFLAVTPLVEKGQLPFEAAQAMLMHMTRRFNFGEEVEDQLSQMKAPQAPQDEGAEAERKALEKEKADFEAEKGQAEMDFKMQEMELELKKKEALLEIQYQQKVMQLESAFKIKEQTLAAQKVKGELQGQIKQVQQTSQNELAKVKSGQQAFQQTVKGSNEGQAKLVESVMALQQEMTQAMAAFQAVVQSLSDNQRAPRRIRDAQGREFSVETLPLNGGMQ